MLRSGSPCWAPRRATALLGILAILFQAILCAWHHHPQPLRSLGASGVRSLAMASGNQIPASADDDCPCCFALSHHNVTPVDFFAAPLADHTPLPRLSAAAATRPLPSYLLFRSRAPPPAWARLSPPDRPPRTTTARPTQRRGTQWETCFARGHAASLRSCHWR